MSRYCADVQSDKYWSKRYWAISADCACTSIHENASTADPQHSK